MAAVPCHVIQITEDCHMGTTGETVMPLHHWRLLALWESHINIRPCHFRLPSFFQHNDTLFQYGMKTRKHHTNKTTSPCCHIGALPPVTRPKVEPIFNISTRIRHPRQQMSSDVVICHIQRYLPAVGIMLILQSRKKTTRNALHSSTARRKRRAAIRRKEDSMFKRT